MSARGRHVRVAVIAAASLASLAAGCGQAGPNQAGVTGPAGAPPGPAAGVEPRSWLAPVEPPGQFPGLGRDAVVAARIFAFSDSQLHYQYGKRTFAQSPFAERMSFEVAVRPAALDDGSDLLLQLFLDEHRRHFADHTLVFLGDAADLSCEQEIDAFGAVLARAGVRELLAVTSNHDGFYAGNFTSRRDLGGMLALTDMPEDWTRACSRPGDFADHRLTKGRAVKRLHDLLPAAEPWATGAAWERDGPTEYRDAYLYHVRPLGGGDPGAPPVWGVFLDTVDYRGFDLESARGAGSTGAVSRAQLRFLDRALFETRIAAGARPLTYVVFGHHPYRSLEPRSRERLRAFFAAHPEIVAYVSAHAHKTIERTIRVMEERALPELVVGSTTDAPQSARVIDVQVDLAGERRAVVTHRLVLDAERLCQGIAPMAADALGYTGYRILRDDTPELDVSALDKLFFAMGLDDLASRRVVQGLGALLIENELTRAFARLYLDAPIPLQAAERAALEGILARRYAAGNDVASLRPYLRGHVRPPGATAYAAWHDPTVARILAVAEHGVHRFGAHADLFERVRALRTHSESARRYFLCHAVHAAEAEARTHRRHGDVLYIR